MLRSRRANVPSPRIISWYFPQPSRLTQMLSAWLPAKGSWALVVIVTEKKPTSRARSITSSIRLSPSRQIITSPPSRSTKREPRR